jgi:hypothetical protein
MPNSSITIENLTATRSGEISINSFDSIELNSSNGKNKAKISIQTLTEAGSQAAEAESEAVNPPAIFTYIHNGQILTITIAE